MVYVILAIGCLAIVAIGLVFVGSGVAKTSAMPAQIVIDVHEAIEFCAEAVPLEVSSTLSYDELRRLLRFHLEWIQAFHFTPEGDPDGPIVFEEFDALEYVMERAAVSRLPVDPKHAAAVIRAHSAYLQAMGAIHEEDPTIVQADLDDLPLLTEGGEPRHFGSGEAD
ncbi:MAG: hypothetical protein R2706_16870 [Acidimicrobiales bacterium]